MQRQINKIKELFIILKDRNGNTKIQNNLFH